MEHGLGRHNHTVPSKELVTAYPADISEELIPYEASLFWFRTRNRLVNSVLDHYFCSAETILEIGCGAGSVLTAIGQARPKMSLFGTDIHISSLRLARKRLPRAALMQSDANRLPFRSEFDVVGAFDLLEHLEDDLHVLRQLREALRPGGGVIITVPQHSWLWSPTDRFASHLRRYSQSDLKAKMETTGFRVVVTTSFITLLLPLMYLSRLKLKMRSRRTDRERFLSELRIAGKLNHALEMVCLAEEWLIGNRVRLPVGGSLLAVGIKE